MNGQYKKAIELAKEVLKNGPDQVEAYLILVTAYSSSDRLKEAHKAAEEVLRIYPNFSIEYYAKMLPYKHQESADETIDALRKAGLPE